MDCIEELYLEHEGLVTEVLPEIKHVDLWAEQVSFLQEEHPFKSPAIFFGYRSNDMDDLSQKVQNVNLQVDVYYYYETFYDTNRGAKKQGKGLEFLKMLSKINAVFHGVSGQYFSNMRRVGFTPVETGTANILYLQRFECSMVDESARVLSEQRQVDDVNVVEVDPPAYEPNQTPGRPAVDF